MPELVSQHKDGVLIVQFTSQKILSDVLIAQIGRELIELVDQAEGKMVVDFSGVTFMASTMIGKLTFLDKKCRTSGTIVKMCNIAPNIMEVFVIIRLDKVLSIYDSLDDALKAFQQRKWLS
jgi:anti-anti-sigma factor